MADFAKALSFVLGNEGGFADDPVDEGGATNYGISLRFLLSLSEDKLRAYGIHVPPDVMAVEKMTINQATAIYQGEFWSVAPFADIPRQSICNYVFDMGVNHGVNVGIKLLQRAICATMGSQDYVLDDGILGPKTISSLTHSTLYLPAALIAQRAQYYRMLCVVRPAQVRFLNTWLRRAFRYG